MGNMKKGVVTVKRSIVVLTVIMLGLMVSAPESEAKVQKIAAGKKVTFDYVLTIDGQTIETSENVGPLEYTHGEGGILKGLEKRLAGLKVGDVKTITIPAQEAYGQVRPEAVREFPKSTLPENFTPQVGAIVRVENDSGQKFPVTIAEIRDETIVLNLNHPLAGKDLQFDVTVVAVK